MTRSTRVRSLLLACLITVNALLSVGQAYADGGEMLPDENTALEVRDNSMTGVELISDLVDAETTVEKTVDAALVDDTGMAYTGEDNGLVAEGTALLPAATRNARLAWFYKPPTDGNLTNIANNFATYVLTQNDEEERDALKRLGVTGPFIQYIRSEAIMDPGSCTATPWKNQVANRPGDFCNIRDQHPTWFLRDTNGNPIVDVEGSTRWYLMDPGNAEWRAFFLSRLQESQETYGWDGAFLDNVEASLVKRQKLGAIPAKYQDDASYQAAVKSLLSHIWFNYFKPTGRKLQANIIQLKTESTWYSYNYYLTGAMEEGWAVDWSSGYLSAAVWERHLYRAEKSQLDGDDIVLVAQGDRYNYQRQQFAYGSFLLVTNGKASFRYGNDASYRDAWVYSNYNLNLGSPLGARYKESTGTWRRDFTNGYVRVDPVAHTATIVVR
jgi:hypothetical protein